MNFMNLAEQYTKDAKYVIIPKRIEGKVSYGKGASKGPDAIIEASSQLEYYDEQYDCEPFLKGIEISDQAKEGQFPIYLGGDHSVTIDTVPENCSVIIFDAHPDCFHSWNGSQKNHRCTAQRLSEKHQVLMVGIRSMDKDEVEIINQNNNLDMIKAYDYSKEAFIEKVSKLKGNIYISIDVDSFDPSFIKNTGTPEPGGFFWNEMINMLETIFSKKNVVGCDIVEFAPEENYRAEAYSLAKLCYKILALKEKYNE